MTHTSSQGLSLPLQTTHTTTPGAGTGAAGLSPTSGEALGTAGVGPGGAVDQGLGGIGGDANGAAPAAPASGIVFGGTTSQVLPAAPPNQGGTPSTGSFTAGGGVVG